MRFGESRRLGRSIAEAGGTVLYCVVYCAVLATVFDSLLGAAVALEVRLSKGPRGMLCWKCWDQIVLGDKMAANPLRCTQHRERTSTHHVSKQSAKSQKAQLKQM